MYFGGGSGAGRERSVGLLAVIALAGVVLGGFIGVLFDMLSGVANWLGFLKWLNFGFDFGLASPLYLDLGIITLTFGLTVKFTVCGLVGLFIAILFYRRFH